MKKIKCFDGYYATEEGNIISLKGVKPRVLKSNDNGRGYLFVTLMVSRIGENIKKNQKSKNVHRLIAEAFIKNPKNRRDINHKDGNKKNNNISNLEWVTHSYNMKHAFDTGLNIPGAKLNDKDVLNIREMLSQGITQMKISHEYNISLSLVYQIKYRKVRKNI